ncbi:hypothetical protein ACFLY5_00200 [Patescibacteria group bacterium]
MPQEKYYSHEEIANLILGKQIRINSGAGISKGKIVSTHFKERSGYHGSFLTITYTGEEFFFANIGTDKQSWTPKVEGKICVSSWEKPFWRSPEETFRLSNFRGTHNITISA